MTDTEAVLLGAIDDAIDGMWRSVERLPDEWRQRIRGRLSTLRMEVAGLRTALATRIEGRPPTAFEE